MKISGFTFVRNATKLFYPIKASIESVLPIVDEFVVALGDNDPDDTTREEILSIQSDKIRIIDTVWDLKNFPNGMEYARQTDIAKNACTGDWLFYIQSDEVIHEKYLPAVLDRCTELFNDQEVDGLLFDFKHFWGDFNHHIVSHSWYPVEIRMIRNKKSIHSWRDAQSFRIIENFDGKSYSQKAGTEKLSVAKVDACIHHYGYVRPPQLMGKKSANHNANYKGTVAELDLTDVFDYGDLSRFTLYNDSHPEVLKDWIKKFDWQELLYPNIPTSKKYSHDKLKNKVLTCIEQNFLGGRTLFGFHNYHLLKK